jgi:hypothetical protein
MLHGLALQATVQAPVATAHPSKIAFTQHAEFLICSGLRNGFVLSEAIN